jgi:16S rRNA (uracil1498-N3)-methyltransferase
VVRTCVELGLDRLTPVAGARSVTRLQGARATKAVARWRAVARSASEQSRRLHRPEVEDVTATRDLDVGGAWLLAHPGGDVGLPAALERWVGSPESAPSTPETITLAVGPEGGWSSDEVRWLVEAGAQPVHLGPSVLRTEHAAGAALAVIAAWTGRWG